MRFLKYWAFAETNVDLPKYGVVHLRKWMGSDISKDEAKKLAKEAIVKLADRVRTKKITELGHYGYDGDALREELLEEKGEPGKPLYAISRNRYGALVLNSPEILFADIDGTNERSFLESILWLAGKRPSRKGARSRRESDMMETLEAFFKSRPHSSGRLYQTAKGLRLLLTHDHYSPEAAETRKLLQELNSDPLYVKLCEKQKCFRARLTPKPWRLKLGLPPSYPRESSEEEKDFEEWLSDYEQQSNGYAACTFVQAYGTGLVGSEMAQLIDAHDKWTKAESNLPLA